MQNKSLLVSVALIVALVIGGYFLVKNNSSEEVKVPLEEEPTTPTGLINETLIKEESYATPDDYAVFNVIYPQFSNASASFNQKIKTTVMDGVKSHQNDAKANWKARLETKLKTEEISEFPKEEEKLPFETIWLPIQANENYISFVLLIRAYSGGAHGYENIISFNYDIKEKKEVALKDLFPGDANYLKSISVFARNDLEKQFKERLEVKTTEDESNFKVSIIPMLEEGTTPEAKNFSVFTFTPEQITFYFTEYQVAPYAMGSSIVSMPR